MAEFNWNDNGDDPLDGYDSEPEIKVPSPTPAVSARSGTVSAAKLLDKPNVIEQVVDEIEESAGIDADSFSEAEWRLEKAQYYRAVINSQLLSSNHPAAVEVEQELQQWAKDQMEVLLGIKPKEGLTSESILGLQSQLEAHVNGNLHFTEQEVDVLKAVAARVLNKGNNASTSLSTPPKAPESAAQTIVPAVKPAVSKPAASVTPAKTADKPRPTGRGRPRTKPCSICGQMDCGHKSNQGKIPEGTKVVKTPEAETFQGMPIQIVDGKRVVDMPNGVRYRIDRRTVQYKDGTIKEEDVPFELSRPIQTPRAIPYPSEQDAINIAAAEAAAAESKMQRSPLFSSLVKAAQAAPAKESYVPQRQK